MSDSDVPVFKGGSGTDCEEFIRSVHTYAFDKGKAEDNKWIAAFAATRFSGPVLRWFARLSPDARTDWLALQIALLDEYPADYIDKSTNEVSSSSAEATIPTPAAAAPAPAPAPLVPNAVPEPDADSLRSSPGAKGTLVRIRLKGADGTFRGWLADNLRHRVGSEVTETDSDALWFRIENVTRRSNLYIVKGDEGSQLGIRWRDPSPSFGSGSQSFARLLPLDRKGSPVQGTLGFYMKGEYRSDVWTIDDSGRVAITWKTATRDIPLYLAVNSNGKLYLTVDMVSYLERFPGGNEVGLVYEST
ncbi:hypothetical protein M407DRAFT_24127 [Tulasnella calospora MUT 4182]|uniref:Uncharacterized protein n=1 Tax=Tulasnella calospora MUT 4182 TaxID=1051891 RepID=A0A0C3QIB2_9AGAM|nr:hypothetical protein M407DRAFT_24127 [Tulasnella calospora MUT 4182]